MASSTDLARLNTDRVTEDPTSMDPPDTRRPAAPAMRAVAGTHSTQDVSQHDTTQSTLRGEPRDDNTRRDNDETDSDRGDRDQDSDREPE